MRVSSAGHVLDRRDLISPVMTHSSSSNVDLLGIDDVGYDPASRDDDTVDRLEDANVVADEAINGDANLALMAKQALRPSDVVNRRATLSAERFYAAACHTTRRRMP
jgi:hypothetical protein